MNDALDAISALLVIYSSVPATVATVIYLRRRLPDSQRFAWLSSVYGVALMLSLASTALILDFTLLFRLVDVPGAHLIQAAVFAILAAGSTLMCGAVIKAGRK